MFPQTVEYALRAAVHLAMSSQQTLKTSEIADRTKVPAAHLSKVLQGLSAEEIVQLQRGVGGGVRLAKAPGRTDDSGRRECCGSHSADQFLSARSEDAWGPPVCPAPSYGQRDHVDGGRISVHHAGGTAGRPESQCPTVRFHHREKLIARHLVLLSFF